MGNGAALLILAAIVLWAWSQRKEKPSEPEPEPYPEEFTCPVCGEVFGAYDDLVWHMQDAHPTEPIPEPPPLPPPLPEDAITIDKFEIRCDFAANVVTSRITVTNHTTETLMDARDYEVGIISPSYDINGYRRLSNTFRHGYHTGNLAPGTHVLSGRISGQEEGYKNMLGNVGIIEGIFGFVDVYFWYKNTKPTPDYYYTEVHQYFEGIYSASWQKWSVSSLRPAPFDPFM